MRARTDYPREQLTSLINYTGVNTTVVFVVVNATAPAAGTLPSSCDTLLMRGNIVVNRTYDTHKNTYIYLILLTIFGPIYYGPP